MACFVLALQRAGVASPWRNWRVITSLSASAVLLILFMVNELLMGSRAMIQGHLLRKRNIATNLIYQFFIAGLFFPLSYALPIQFQSVGNESATQSGLRLIPLILGVSVFTLIANGILTFWRRYTPFLVIGSIAGTIGVTMIHTLGADASIGPWIGYEILIGMGVGIALQVPMIANQAAVGIEDLAAVTSLTMFVENVSTAIFIASTEAAFTNGLVKALAYNAPNVKPEVVINTGATGIRMAFRPDQVSGILRSYLQGCQDSHFVPIACGASAVLVSMVIAIPAAAKEFDSRIRKRN
jgi:MFS transporter, DHA2 family, glioxin efflux transporter